MAENGLNLDPENARGRFGQAAPPCENAEDLIAETQQKR
jgi:hypothetical protein